MTALTVGFCGEDFTLADDLAYMVILQHSKALEATGEEKGRLLAVAQYDLLRMVLADEEWPRFQQVATRNRSSEEQLWAFINDAVEAIVERPTSRSTDSSGGPSSTDPKSSATRTASDEAEEAFPGRPDLQIAVIRAAEQQAS